MGRYVYLLLAGINCIMAYMNLFKWQQPGWAILDLLTAALLFGIFLHELAHRHARIPE